MPGRGANPASAVTGEGGPAALNPAVERQVTTPTPCWGRQPPAVQPQQGKTKEKTQRMKEAAPAVHGRRPTH